MKDANEESHYPKIPSAINYKIINSKKKNKEAINELSREYNFIMSEMTRSLMDIVNKIKRCKSLIKILIFRFHSPENIFKVIVIFPL